MSDVVRAVARANGTARALRATGIPTDAARSDALILELREVADELEAATLTARSKPQGFDEMVTEAFANLHALIAEAEQGRSDDR